ncbi:Tetratricopeptide repeat (TPR)-like superfamily protein [Heracleum sosnowskyi]|uniref:Tetratricopeptide repeat (TPR)-like superfamily protein n=1 Tax=Heracleum sosnowskyi TaxID=360622 RepID=A0AAD8MEF8_9APIA|nr:Tetratricopeptide repeat (TPR)-like superfamily protein [Heracleum sosnowskyi]
MGNTMVSCYNPNTSPSATKLIFWEGTTRILTGKRTPIAGEIMFEFPDRMVCHADSFYIGQPIPALAIEDELLIGQTYFVLPIDCFSCNVLSASAFAALVANSCSPRKTNPSSLNFKDTTFEYIKGSNGRVLIKVSPEFMIKMMTVGKENGNDGQVIDNKSSSFLCSTPELKKHYHMLIGSKGQMWSPKLDTISECKNFSKFSPRRYISKKNRLSDL